MTQRLIVTQKLIVTYGQRKLDFGQLDVMITLDRARPTTGTEITLKRYKADPANAVIPMISKKNVTYKLTSDVFKLSTSKPMRGDITIEVPYDESLVGKENKLSIACYDAETDTWVLVKAKFNKAQNTITFTTDVFTYFMVVESVKNK